MTHPIKIAEFDLSFFTGDPTWLVMTADEAEHGYDYTLAHYRGDDSNALRCIEQWAFYDQASADNAADFMAAKIKDILS